MPLHQNPEMIGQAIRQLLLQQRTMQKIQTSLLQGPQRCHQVAAVHGGNEPGPKRFERARVIPVEQVAVRSRKLRHGGQSSQGLLGKFRDGQKSEFASHLAGVQKKAQVGGRNARRDGGRFFLHIVRNQPVVLLGAELGEVSPGAERGAAKKQLVLVGSFVAHRARRQVQPHRNPFAATPEQQDGQRGEKSAAAGEEHQDAQCQRQRRHPVEIDVDRSALVGAQFGFRRGFPFEQPPPRHQPPDQGSHHGIERKQHLMRQETTA